MAPPSAAPIASSISIPVYGELLIRQATGHATLFHPSLYVIDSKRAFSFGEAQHRKLQIVLQEP